MSKLKGVIFSIFFLLQDKIGDNLRKKLEKQIADHDIKGMGLTVGVSVNKGIDRDTFPMFLA